MYSIIIYLLLILLMLLVAYRLRVSELKRIKTEKRQEELEKDNKKLEREKKFIEQEKNNITEINSLLSSQLKELISERDLLQSLMKGNTIVSNDIVSMIKSRLKILNELIASYITADEKSMKNSLLLIKKATQNKEEFLNSTRTLYKTLYPDFMTFLYEKKLTDYEIDYICLQLIGLRGKEIGEFMNTSRHYHISSAIRTKLGLSQNDPNLGSFILSMLK